MGKLTLVIGNKNYSSWSLRPWLLLKQAGIEFEEVKVALHQDPSVILRYSPSGKVPVLMDGDTKIWESLAICEYIAEKFPEKHLWPDDPKARAFARSVSSEMHAGFQVLRQNMPMNCQAKFPRKKMAPGVQDDINRVTAIWHEARERYGKSGGMLFGRFSVADAMFAPVAIRFMVYDVKLDLVSQTYQKTILSLPVIQEWLMAAQAEAERIPEYEPAQN